MIHTQPATVGEVAGMFRVSEKTVYRWRKSLNIGRRVGRAVHFTPADLERLAEHLSDEGEARPAA